MFIVYCDPLLEETGKENLACVTQLSYLHKPFRDDWLINHKSTFQGTSPYPKGNTKTIFKTFQGRGTVGIV